MKEEVREEEEVVVAMMTNVGIYEFNAKDLIGHGAFAVVYKGRLKSVSSRGCFRNQCCCGYFSQVTAEQCSLLLRWHTSHYISTPPLYSSSTPPLFLSCPEH